MCYPFQWKKASQTKASAKDPGVILTARCPQLCQLCPENAVYTGVRAYTPQGSAQPQRGAAPTLIPGPAAPVPHALGPPIPLQAMPCHRGARLQLSHSCPCQSDLLSSMWPGHQSTSEPPRGCLLPGHPHLIHRLTSQLVLRAASSPQTFLRIWTAD